MTEMKRIGIIGAALGVIVLAGSWRPAVAQGPRNEDVLPALLTEVKGLRAAMEQMASANASAQLLVGRLQLQETRMSGMIRRLDTVRDTVVAAENQYNQANGALQMFESEKNPNERMSQGEKDDLLGGFKRQVAAAKANVDRLKAEETQLSNDLSAEQGRWIEINRRLDELERSLGKR